MIATCQALVSTVIGLGVEEEDRKRTWMADADELLKRGSVETARAIYKKACEDFPGKKSVWRCAADEHCFVKHNSPVCRRLHANSAPCHVSIVACRRCSTTQQHQCSQRQLVTCCGVALTHICLRAAGGRLSAKRLTEPRRAWTSSWPGPSGSARTLRCCGSCGPRSAGWLATCRRRERSFGRCDPNPPGDPHVLMACALMTHVDLPCVLHQCHRIRNIVRFDAGPGDKGCPGMQAHAAKADSEAIWLAAFKLEFENKEPVRAAALMVKARESPVQTQRVWMKSAIVERELVRPSETLLMCILPPELPLPGSFQASLRCERRAQYHHLLAEQFWFLTLEQQQNAVHTAFCLAVTVQIGMQGNTEEEQRLLEEGLQRFPAFDKLWLMLGQLEERRGRAAAARTAYQNGLKRCIHRCETVCQLPCDTTTACTCCARRRFSLELCRLFGRFAGRLPLYLLTCCAWWCSVALWRSAARLEEQGGSVARARALLEQGRSKNLKEPDIWLAAVRTEQRAGLPKAADALIAKALQVSTPSPCPSWENSSCSHSCAATVPVSLVAKSTPRS